MQLSMERTDRDDVLNVFIHGDMPEKTQRIMGLYNVEEKEAVKMMADTDKRRMTNYNFYTDQKWGKTSNYTLCLNSSQLGYDRCEAIIIDCGRDYSQGTDLCLKEGDEVVECDLIVV